MEKEAIARMQKEAEEARKWREECRLKQETAKAEKDKKELDEQNRINKETKKTL